MRDLFSYRDPFDRRDKLASKIDGNHPEDYTYELEPFFGPDKVNHAHHRLTRIRHFQYACEDLEDCTGPNWFRFSEAETERYSDFSSALVYLIDPRWRDRLKRIGMARHAA